MKVFYQALINLFILSPFAILAVFISSVEQAQFFFWGLCFGITLFSILDGTDQDNLRERVKELEKRPNPNKI